MLEEYRSKNVEVYSDKEWLEADATEERVPEKKTAFTDFTKKLFRHKGAIVGAVIIFLFIFSAIFAPLLTPYDYDVPDISSVLEAPSGTHLFGTDEFGRDILTRIVYGSRISLEVAFIAVFFSLILGTVLGAIAGYYGGVVDYIITSITDIAWSFPTTLLAIAFIAALGTGVQNVIIAIALASWSGYCRVVRGQFLSLKQREFIEAARFWE